MTDPTAVAPSLIIAHEIDEASPLHGLTPEDIVAAEGAIFVSVSATDDNSKQVSRDSSAQSPPKSVMHTIGSNAVEPRAESDCPVLLAVRDRTDHLPISRHPVESTIPGVCCCQQPPRKGNVMGCW